MIVAHFLYPLEIVSSIVMHVLLVAQQYKANTKIYTTNFDTLS